MKDSVHGNVKDRKAKKVRIDLFIHGNRTVSRGNLAEEFFFPV